MSADDSGWKTIHELDLHTKEALSIGRLRTAAELLAVHRAGIFFRETDGFTGKLYRSVSTATQQTVDVFGTGLENVRLPELKKVSYQSSVAGKTLVTCVRSPPGLRRSLPIVVEVYPDLTFEDCKRSFDDPSSFTADVIASSGYIHVRMSAPLETLGARSGTIDNMPELAFEAAQAVQRAGYGDASRLGLLGTSQGGLAALWIPTKSNAFKATVSINGWADPWGHYFETGFTRLFHADDHPPFGNTIRFENPTDPFGLGVTPWQDHPAYFLNNPVASADKLSAPVLLIHSDMDIFSNQTYDELFTALYRLRKPARSITYFGEAHGPSSPANILHMWSEIVGWYEKYL